MSALPGTFRSPGILAAAVVAIILAPLSANAQIQTTDQLARMIVEEFRNQTGGARQVLVREFRTPGSTDTAITEAVRSKFRDLGYQNSLVADYEVEGRIKTTTSFSGYASRVVELRIVKPTGYDYERQFTIGPGVGGGGGSFPPDDDDDHDHDHDHDHDNGGSSGGGHQVYPNQEWKLYQIRPLALTHVNNGFITSPTEWEHFWDHSNSNIPLPHVDFEEQLVRIDTAPYPRTINVEIFASGGGSLEITKNISNEPPVDAGLLNAHVLILSRADIIQKRKIRLGVTVDAATDGYGVVITSVVPGAPATRGRLDNGSVVALEPGDVVYSLDGFTTNSVGNFADAIRRSDGTLRAAVRNVQNGELIYVTFTLN